MFVCNRNENIVHFFLDSSLFIAPRFTFLNFVLTLKTDFDDLQSQEKVNLLLYGDTSFSFGTNKSLLEATLNYLRETGRFSRT